MTHPYRMSKRAFVCVACQRRFWNSEYQLYCYACRIEIGI